MTNQLPESLKQIAERGYKGTPKTARGIFHSLTKDQRIIMRQKGFLPREIKEFDDVKATDFHSTYFQRMIRSRAKWVEAMKLNKWTNEEIARRIGKFLNRKGKSPWDFFRLEYATTSQKPTLTGLKFASFLTNRRIISQQFGRAYGRIQSVKQRYYQGLPGVPKPS